MLYTKVQDLTFTNQFSLMKRSHSTILALLLISGLLLPACGLLRPDPEPMPCTKLDPDFLAYFAFPEGSWWVYEEVNSGREDSLWVSSYHLSEEVYNEAFNDCFDELYLQIVSEDSTRYFLAQKIQIASPLAGHNALFALQEIFYLEGGTASPFRIIYPPHTDSVLSFNGMTIFPSLNSSYVLNGQTYSPVILTQNTGPYYSRVIETVYAKGIGVITWTTVEGEQWVLKRYRINA